MTETTKRQATAEARAYYAKYLDNGINIKTEARRLWKYLEPWHKGRPLPEIRVHTERVTLGKIDDGFEIRILQNSVAGRAHINEGLIYLEPEASQHTLAHELAHMAVGSHYRRGRQGPHDETFYRALIHVQEKRWKIDIRTYGIDRWGPWTAEPIIERQIPQTGPGRQPFAWERRRPAPKVVYYEPGNGPEYLEPNTVYIQRAS